MMCQSDVHTYPMAEAHYDTNNQDRVSEKPCGEKMLVPPAGSLPLQRWARRPLSVCSRPGTPAYMLQAKTKGKVCIHGLPCANMVPEPTSMLREGFCATTCPSLWTPPLCLGGLQHCHTSLSTGPHLAANEGPDTDTRPSTPDRTRLNGGLWC
jgi:hypothetical protein